jgi:hypothetical protein
MPMPLTAAPASMAACKPDGAVDRSVDHALGDPLGTRVVLLKK